MRATNLNPKPSKDIITVEKNLTYSSYHLDQRWPTSGPQLHQWAPAGRRPSPGQSCCRCRSVPEGHSCSAGPLSSDGGRASFGSSCGSCWKVKDLMAEGCWKRIVGDIVFLQNQVLHLYNYYIKEKERFIVFKCYRLHCAKRLNLNLLLVAFLDVTTGGQHNTGKTVLWLLKG